MNYYEIFQKLPEALRPPMLEFAETIEKYIREQVAVQQNFDGLKAMICELAENCRQSESRMSRLETLAIELTEVHKSREIRSELLENAITELAEIQRRTENRMEELALAQRNTEQRIEELIDAIRHTDRAIGQIAKIIGELNETIGGDIEDIARTVIHNVLKEKFGWQTGQLKRTWQLWSGEPEEVTIFGQATNPQSNSLIWIIGEAKHNLSERDVKRFIDQLQRAYRHLKGEIFPVCFCYRAMPNIQEMLKNANIHIIFSYGELESEF